MPISFTGSDVVQSRFQEGRTFPNSDAMVAVRFTNKGNADLDELKQILKSHPEHEFKDDLVVFDFVTENQGEKGISKKFLLNWKELTANENNSDIFSFFGRKMKELENSKVLGETKTAASHIGMEIQFAMAQLFHAH